MAEILRPRWYIQGDDNTVLPLIALDELPDSVALKDVPVTVTVLEGLRAHIRGGPCQLWLSTDPCLYNAQLLRHAPGASERKHPSGTEQRGVAGRFFVHRAGAMRAI